MQKPVLLIILLMTIPLSVVYGEEELQENVQKITLTADNTAYQEGDIITITGKIEKVIQPQEVTIQIISMKETDEQGPIIGIDQVKVSQDGEFLFTIKTGGPLWQNEGTVIIKASYGDTSTELSIEFFKNTSGKFLSNKEVNIPDAGTFDVQYTMKGGVVSDMKLNQNNLSLEIDIITNSDGTLDINLPRDAIDSKEIDGQDIEFIVLMHGKTKGISVQTDYTKGDLTDEFRSLIIPVKNGDTKIEIIGTHVVPEFGTIAMIVLAVAIISIIAVSAKSRLSIMPRI